MDCWLAERILRPSSREAPARVDHGTHLRADLCYGNNVSRSRIDSVQDRELRQYRGSICYQYGIGQGFPRHEGNRNRITCYIANRGTSTRVIGTNENLNLKTDSKALGI